jgi:glycosyltransferase involved in cell wall biosynthesis
MTDNFGASGSTSRKIAIVTPVLDDWESLDRLMQEIAALPELQGDRITVVAVDDGSSIYTTPSVERVAGAIRQISVVHLKANQSHQRAIALGLAYVYRELDVDAVVVMDSDGEDRPTELPNLLAASARAPRSIIVAQRRKRTEGASFQAGYFVYKALFRTLTGKEINFGNFSLIPAAKLSNVLFNTNIWNNYAATILRSRVSLEFVATDRGTRYFGSSKMSFTSLIVHGMSAISVFSDLVISRMIMGLGFGFVLFILAVVGIVSIKMVVDYFEVPGYFVPGYATNLILSLTNILVSSMLVGLMVILTLLAARSQTSALPTRLLDDLVDDIDQIPSRVAEVQKAREA